MCPSPSRHPETFSLGHLLGVPPEERELELLKDAELPKTKTAMSLAPEEGDRDWLWAPHLLPGWIVGSTDDPPQTTDIVSKQGDEEA